MKRYIAGLNAEGRSDVLRGGAPPRVWGWQASTSAAPHDAGRQLVDDFGSVAPGAGVTAELWTVRASADEVVLEDPAGYADAPGPHSFELPAGVVRWSVTRFGAGYESKMHRTDSIDFDVLLEGDIELVLEDAAVQLQPGDAVVVPGVDHCWRTAGGATLMFTMVSPHPMAKGS